MKKFITLLLAALTIGTLPLFAQEKSGFQLSTHVLDTCKGTPAEGVGIVLYKLDPATLQWVFVDKEFTSETGRISDFLPAGNDNLGTYKLRFETQEYFQKLGVKSIYPYIEVVFYINDGTHYHIPITLAANGYATYRGN